MTPGHHDDDTTRGELAACRADIERLDSELLQLLAQRVQLGRRVGALKRTAGLPVLDPKREAKVIRSAAEQARALELPPEPVREIFWQIIALVRRTQSEGE